MPRPRKGAHIYRRAGRRGWWGYVDRTKKDIPLGDVEEAEANRALADLLDARGLRAQSAGKATISQAFDNYGQRVRDTRTPKYADETDLNLRRILAWLRERDVLALDEISKQTVEDYKAARRSEPSKRRGTVGVSAARVNAELQSWKKALALAVENGDASPGSTLYFERLREPRPLPNRPGLTVAEINRMLGAEKHAGYKSLFRVAVGSGMRDDELRNMDASDIRAPHIVVTPKEGWNTKSFRYRSVPVSKETLAAARDFVKAKREGLNLDQKAVWKRIRAAGVAAKIKKHFSMHDLRRAYASHALAAGFRLEQISRWLGHADLVTTQRYLRVVDEGEVDTKRLVF